MNRKELIEKRSINTKVFENQTIPVQQRFILLLYIIRIQMEPGRKWIISWKSHMKQVFMQQKTNLVSEEGFTNRKGTFGAFFAKKTSEDNMMRIKDQYGSISWGVENCNTVEAVKTER